MERETSSEELSGVQVVKVAGKERIAILCAEAVPWRCHRSLIGDALAVRGIRVHDIMSATRRQVHNLTSFAKVQGSTTTYPAETSKSTPGKPPVKTLGATPIKTPVYAGT